MRKGKKEIMKTRHGRLKKRKGKENRKGVIGEERKGKGRKGEEYCYTIHHNRSRPCTRRHTYVGGKTRKIHL